MSTLLNHHIICLAGIAVVLWAAVNITILLIVRGGSSCHCAECAIAQDIETRIANAKENCDCRCHQGNNMYPGLRCLDCFGEDCDEGTIQ